MSLFSRAALGLGLLFLYAPIAALVVYSFNASALVTVWGGFSLKWYGILFQDGPLLAAALISLRVALASALIATLLGTLAALALGRSGRFLGRLLFTGLVYAPMVMPEVVTGLSLLLLFVGLGLDRGVGTIVIAHATLATGFVAVVVLARLRVLDQNLEEAAADLGAGPFRVLATVTLPLLAPAIAAGFRVEAAGRAFEAPVLLNCAGFWGGRVAAQFGEPVPVYPLNPNMLVTEPLPFFCPHNLGVVGGDVYIRQIARGNVIFGGGRGESDPSVPMSRPLPEPAFAAMARAVEIIPHLADAMIIRSWTGIDGGMPDALPVLGHSRTTPGLIHAFGFSGHGFMLGPAIGAILSELVLDGRTDVPLEAFDIGRFAGHTALEADLWKTRLE